MNQDDYFNIVGWPDSEVPINDLDSEPDLKELLNALDAGIVGSQKPRVEYVKEPLDRYLYLREKEADKLGIPVWELADEPDEMIDHSDQQGWE